MAAVPVWFIEALNESHLRNVIKLLAHQQQLWASPFRAIHMPEECHECVFCLSFSIEMPTNAFNAQPIRYFFATHFRNIYVYLYFQQLRIVFHKFMWCCSEVALLWWGHKKWDKTSKKLGRWFIFGRTHSHSHTLTHIPKDKLENSEIEMLQKRTRRREQKKNSNDHKLVGGKISILFSVINQIKWNEIATHNNIER